MYGKFMKFGEGRNNFPLTENGMRLTQDISKPLEYHTGMKLHG